MEKLIIKKRKEIAAWKVDASEVCPNTLLVVDEGLVVFVKVDGEFKYTSKSGITVHSLFNPTKSTKLFGGKKPYTECEVTVIDTETSFNSEWGFGGPNAITCKDKEVGIRAKVRAFGTFTYKIEDYFGFARSLNFEEKDTVSREELRDELRSGCVTVVRAVLASKLANETPDECQSHMVAYREEIRKALDKALVSRGLAVNDFEIGSLQYSSEHEAKLDAIDDAKFDNVLGAIKNEGRRDDLTVKKQEADIDISLINANKGSADASDANNAKIYCQRCGEANVATARFCSKCGNKIRN